MNNTHHSRLPSKLERNGRRRRSQGHAPAAEYSAAVLAQIASRTAYVTGNEFLKTLVRELAVALEVPYVFVSECLPGQPNRVRTVAFWKRNRLAENFEYELEGTPCEAVLNGAVCYYPTGVQARFPDDPDLVALNAQSYLGIPLCSSSHEIIGHLALLHDRPTWEQERLISTLQIFAARAAAELERKLAEAAHRESEEKYRILVEHSLQGITILQDGRIVFANQAIADLFGYTVDELLALEPEQVDALIHPDDRRRVQENIEARLAGREVPSRYEVRIVRKDGRVGWMEIAARRITYRGRPAILTFDVDVTERKLAEQALRESETRFRALIERSFDVILLFDADSRIRYASPSIERLLGYKPEDVLGLPKSELIHPEERGYMARMFEEALNTPGKLIRCEHRLRHRDGSYRTVEGMGVNLLQEPAVKAIIGNYRDVTERCAAEEALRQSEQKFRQLFTNSPDAILVADANGRLLDVNPAACRLHKMDCDALKQKTLIDLVPPEHRESAQRQLKQLLENGGRYLESFSLASDGRVIPVEIHASRITFGDRPALLLHVRDISQRKQLEAQLLHAQKLEAIGRLAGGIAHDFNNLLTVILGSAEFGLQATSPGELCHEEFANILRTTQQASDLTGQLLAFSRSQVHRPQLVNLNRLIAQHVQMLKRIIGEHIELRTELEAEQPVILGDPNQIEQVLMNVSVNARDAMPNGGRITISTRTVVSALVQTQRSWPGPAEGDVTPAASHYVEIAIADTGIGMDEATAARIFEPFFTTKEVRKGTGLGLAVVYGIVTQHRGHVRVKTARGQGTTLYIYFPVHWDQKADEPDRREQTNLCGKESIFIVEDEPAVLKVAVRMLRNLGYTVYSTHESREALTFFQERAHRIDLVILDVVMPGLSGPDLYRQMVALRPNLPVIFVTGYDFNAEVEQLELNGVSVCVLQKPYTQETLGEKIRAVLKESAR